MLTIKQVFKSRTNWTVVIMIATQVLQMSQGTLSPDLFLLLQSALASLAVYFRSTPVQGV